MFAYHTNYLLRNYYLHGMKNELVGSDCATYLWRLLLDSYRYQRHLMDVTSNLILTFKMYFVNTIKLCSQYNVLCNCYQCLRRLFVISFSFEDVNWQISSKKKIIPMKTLTGNAAHILAYISKNVMCLPNWFPQILWSKTTTFTNNMHCVILAECWIMGGEVRSTAYPILSLKSGNTIPERWIVHSAHSLNSFDFSNRSFAEMFKTEMTNCEDFIYIGWKIII